MIEEPRADDVDRAVDTAIRRTADTQSHIDDVIDEGLIPPEPVLADVVQRAEDLRELAQRQEDEARRAAAANGPMPDQAGRDAGR